MMKPQPFPLDMPFKELFAAELVHRAKKIALGTWDWAGSDKQTGITIRFFHAQAPPFW